jgi:hypothetical protein
MPWYAHDDTGRLPSRPVYSKGEIEKICVATVRRFLEEMHGVARFPLETEDLKKLIERDTSDFDEFADLAALGSDVEGYTDFYADRLPAVRIDHRLSDNPRRERRLRMTLAHEYAHVLLHAPLWRDGTPPPVAGLPKSASALPSGRGPRRSVDWMEWQANYAAGAILMPYPAVADLLGGLDHGSDCAVDEHDRAVITAVTSHFVVSWSAATVRLRQLGVLRRARRIARR